MKLIICSNECLVTKTLYILPVFLCKLIREYVPCLCKVGSQVCCLILDINYRILSPEGIKALTCKTIIGAKISFSCTIRLFHYSLFQLLHICMYINMNKYDIQQIHFTHTCCLILIYNMQRVFLTRMYILMLEIFDMSRAKIREVLNFYSRCLLHIALHSGRV